jgi:maltose/moltooligosaccharide transporter
MVLVGGAHGLDDGDDPLARMTVEDRDGLLSVAVIGEKHLLLLSMAGVGVAWASIVSMPYAILSGSIPPARTGLYMGIFNFFIVIPEICASLGLGWVMEHVLGQSRVAGVVAGGGSLVVAALLTLRVRDAAEEAGT